MEKENVIKTMYVQELGWFEVTKEGSVRERTYSKIEFFIDSQGNPGYKCLAHNGDFVTINPKFIISLEFFPETVEESMKE